MKMRVSGKVRWALLSAVLLLAASAPIAQASAVTITYSANSSQFQAGYVSGTAPAVGNYNSGDLVTVAANSGNLARAGFTFLGWNTAADGSGTTYTPGTGTLIISTSITLYADWQIPASARLIGSTGSMVSLTNPDNVTNGSNCTSTNIRGITSDGTYLYFRSTSGSSILCQVTMNGVVHAAISIAGLSSITIDSRALAYSAGCIFIRPLADTTSLSCIEMATWTLHSVTLPGSYPLILGGGWLNGNLIDFPDGRIGAVSIYNQSLTAGTGPGQCPSGFYCKVLRLYTLAGTGANVSPTFSEDIILADNQSGWPSDDHGISTDGTYLYEIKYNSGYKVWALASGSPSYLVFNGDGSGSCGAATGLSNTFCPINSPLTGSDNSFSNATYLGRNNVTGEYIMGDYSASRFYKSAAATPPAGPGNPAPAISSISPSTTTSTGGDTATITGTGFTTATSVTIGGVTATIISTSANSIVIRFPANSIGVKDLVVNASTGSATSAGAVTITGAYVLTYNGNGSTGGSVPVDTTSPYSAGDTLTVQANSGALVRSGFTFSGWNTAANGTGNSYAANATLTMPASSTTLYAQWVQNSLAGVPSSALTLLATFSIHTGIGSSGSFTTSSSSGSVTIPINALPDGTTAKLYALGDITSLSSLLPSSKTYFLSFVLSWLAADGTVPTVSGSDPITMVISNSDIKVGTVVYGVTGGQLTTLATATQEGTVTVPITADPALVVGNPTPQNSSGTPTPTIQSPTQVDVISSYSPIMGSTAGGMQQVITGHFEENICKVANIFIGEYRLAYGSWSVTSNQLSFTMPAHAAGITAIEIYDGCTPILPSLNFTYVSAITDSSTTQAPPVAPPVAPMTTSDSTTASSTDKATSQVPPQSPVTKGPLPDTLALKIYFDMGSAQVKGANLQRLVELARRLAGLGNAITIRITGYAQPTPGSEASDGALSKRRAAAVAKFLRKYGVNTRLTYLGAGRAAVNDASSRYVQIVAANS